MSQQDLRFAEEQVPMGSPLRLFLHFGVHRYGTSGTGIPRELVGDSFRVQQGPEGGLVFVYRSVDRSADRISFGTNRDLIRVSGGREEERLADVFALNLLMPKKIFRETALSKSPSISSLLELTDCFHTSRDATARRIVELDIWKCFFMWCVPEKMYGGEWAVRVNGWKSAPILGKPPCATEKYIRWGTNLVRRAYSSDCAIADTICLPVQFPGGVRAWRFEGIRHLTRKGEGVLAFMRPEDE